MQTNIRFDLQPKQRPKLAEEIATVLQAIPCYQKVPSMAYKIGDCTLEKDGTLRIPDTVEKENLYTAESPVNREFTALLQKNGVCLVFKYM